MVQIDDIMIILLFQNGNQYTKLIIQLVDPVNIRICPYNRIKLFLHEKMDFRIFHLLFQAPDYRSCKNNISY